MTIDSTPLSKPRQLFVSVIRWFDSWAGLEQMGTCTKAARVDWLRCLPLFAVHAMCLGVIWVGWSWTAVAVCIALYWVRMFAITGWYHRYFAHRSFKTSRWCQLAFAVLGASATERGPLWWAGNHRQHHRFSDQEDDPHSPITRGFLWAHIGWITSRVHYAPKLKLVQDLVKYPELRFLDRFDTLVPTLLGTAMFFLGVALEHFAPSLGTTGPQMLIWGYFISTTLLLHGTFTINSLTHLIGRKRYVTGDESRNHWLLAIITMGEGWHNNHHYYQPSSRMGFYWWEIDLSYYVLVMMSWLGLVWDLTPVPEHVRESGRIGVGTAA
ncbi:MAG: acyl-CoA desaturase [Nitrospirae bacterium]|nr:acyl-CoA desaturase [Nitrospirota bacterium]